MKRSRPLFHATPWALLLAVLAAGCGGTVLPVRRDGSRPADLVVMNADVFTASASPPQARAVAVKGERIVYVGDDRGVLDHVGPHTRVIEARGRMLTPGFIDSHCHVLWMGALMGIMADLYPTETFDQMKRAVTSFAGKNPDLPFVMGIGWRYDTLPGGMPTAALADSIIADRPLLLWSYGGHTGWCNSAALEWMQKRNPSALRRLTPQMDEKTHKPTGLLLHFWAFNPFDYLTDDEVTPQLRGRLYKGMRSILTKAVKTGVTTMNDVQLYKPFLPLVLDFRKTGGLDRCRVRMNLYVDHYSMEDGKKLKADLEEWIAAGKKHSSPHLRLGGSVKMYSDGVPGTHTALMLEPYSDKPGEHGHKLWDPAKFMKAVQIVDSLGLQACIHGCGDAAIRMVVDACERAGKASGPRDARHRIEHCELPHPRDIKRMARLGIHAAMQPTHLYGNERTVEALGRERLQRIHPWRSLQDAGVEVSFGSDWCAGPINPVYGLIIGSTRVNYAGKRDWGPREALDIDNIIRNYTLGSARALKMERDVGSIEVGKYADFVLFSKDLRAVATTWFLLTHKVQIGALDDFVLLTVVGGKIVYHRPGEAF